MSGAPVASLLVLLTLSDVLAVSGLAKLRTPLAVEDAFVALRVPTLVPRRAAARLLPWLELALAALLLLSPAGPLVAVGAVVVALMATYTVLVARATGFEGPVDCACFGSLGQHRVDSRTVARNLLLLALSVVATLVALDGGSAPAAAGRLGSDGWWTLAAAAAAVAVAVLVVGGRPDAEPERAGEPVLEYERQPIPYGVLRMPDGTTATLAELASTQARLLVVLNTHCGPCLRTAEKLDAWAARLAPAVGLVAVYAEDGLTTTHADTLSAVEPDRNVRRVFSVGAPGAVLLGADGLMAGGPVAGERDVERFVDDVAEQLAEAPPLDLD
ncbi:TlpA family protein disulfide reductase [Nocardioides zeicaulis]|uniref:TlpA family protein disulfide reductase n=1 Tax=Nocardioides zeicaulis TaxID=1776857 RepID=A0ABV6DZR7_9ACTN